ncbi:WG repeat-containing protein [Hymenobacter sp. 15J16-1T3B]|uniref:WG repeat-containing protein n=1 Tax=Hymenobacter sp. 15J16-1T3B TaxID=2886941 RepID=UPI001D12ECEB|nr:WG repeat-containing protein [Hymenobacter sp. 15J16-1T3B]MCC3156335.1 WG repeat-containing protein [Hymenobacter sp. 15J16-1T3B]
MIRVAWLPAVLLGVLVSCGPAAAQFGPARLVPYRKGAQWGYADRRGRVVLPLRYDEAGPFVDEIAWVRVGQLYGYIDGAGNPVTPVQYERAGTFRGGRARVSLPGGDTFDIDSSGQRLTQPPEEVEEDFMAQGDPVRRGGKVGFRFTVGSAEVPPVYDEVRDLYHDGLVLVRRGPKWGVVDNRGRLRLEPQFDAITAVEQNGYQFPIVEQQGRFGYLGADGKLLVTPKYAHAEPFVAGVARVTTATGQTGYIDTEGREYFE